MTRIWIRLMLPLNLAFIVLMTGVFTLFYDTAYFDRIRAFIMSDCAIPCFMGVHHYGFSIRTYTARKDFWEAPADIVIASWHASYDYSVHRLYDFATIRQIACKDHAQ